MSLWSSNFSLHCSPVLVVFFVFSSTSLEGGKSNLWHLYFLQNVLVNDDAADDCSSKLFCFKQTVRPKFSVDYSNPSL